MKNSTVKSTKRILNDKELQEIVNSNIIYIAEFVTGRAFHKIAVKKIEGKFVLVPNNGFLKNESTNNEDLYIKFYYNQEENPSTDKIRVDLWAEYPDDTFGAVPTIGTLFLNLKELNNPNNKDLDLVEGVYKFMQQFYDVWFDTLASPAEILMRGFYKKLIKQYKGNEKKLQKLMYECVALLSNEDEVLAQRLNNYIEFEMYKH
jgi:hypothetical protein